MDLIQQELNKMNLSSIDFSILDRREETILARLVWNHIPCVLKCYRTESAKREIKNYALLSSLGITTPHLLEQTDSAILMEDLSIHPVFRLGIKDDLHMPQTAEKIALWYRMLHEKGKAPHILQDASLYEEAAHFTRKSIAKIARHTQTTHLPVWKQLDTHFDEVFAIYRNLGQTLNYNDFYYTNLAVAKDDSKAMMFDYHLLGRGYAFADVRNVCASLAKEAQMSFLHAYGPIDPLEAAADAVLSPIVTLHLACQRSQFPSWAKESLAFLETGMEDAITALLSMQ